MENIYGKRLVSGREFQPKESNRRDTLSPRTVKIRPIVVFAYDRGDNRVLRIVPLDSFHENRKIRVSYLLREREIVRVIERNNFLEFRILFIISFMEIWICVCIALNWDKIE